MEQSHPKGASQGTDVERKVRCLPELLRAWLRVRPVIQCQEDTLGSSGKLRSSDLHELHALVIWMAGSGVVSDFH